MSGLERSVALLAQLLEQLEARGVLVKEVSAKDFFGESPSNEDAVLFQDLIDWLLSEGVIRRVREPKGDGFGWVWFHKIVLTSQGFHYLAQIQPDGQTLAENVKRIVASPNVGEVAGGFVGSLLASFTKGLSS